MLNKFSKMLNKIAKPNSKNQEEKKKKLKEKPIQYITCCECKSKSNPLRKIDKDIYKCINCINKKDK